MKRKNVFRGMVFIPLFNLLFFSSLFAQNPFWTFPEQGLGGNSMFTLPTDDYNGQEADHVHAGLKDPYGDIMFFAMDGKLYDEFGEERSEFDDSVDLIKGSSEMLIVPRPGSCNIYYIFQAKPTGFQDDDHPYVSVYNDSLGGLVGQTIGGYYKTAFDIIDDFNLIEDSDWSNPDHGVEGVHFAATREFPTGERFIFVSTNGSLFLLILTCDGLTAPVNWQYDLFQDVQDFSDFGWRNEIELYEDTANSTLNLAIPYNKPEAQGNIKVAHLWMTYNADILPNSQTDIVIPNQANESPSYVHGVEFSPDGNLIYIIHDPYPGASSPLSYYDLSTSTLTNLNCADILDFKNTQIQLAGDSGNYSLYFASEDYLGTLTDPNNPNCNNWTPNAIPFSGGYSTNLGGNASTSMEDIKRIIPDQIDFMDYDTTFVKASCDCCRKYAYAQDKQDTSKIINGGTSWTPGFGNNPWDAGINDTIFIRDSILVRRGVNLTISDLNFRFGKEGVFIVQRGDEVTPGAIVTLTDSTHMTTDFRCSGREYTCRDPKNEECDTLNFWQGIRVEGFPNESQSLGSTKQGRLNMEKGSTIEYAAIGILAGHEKFDQYGGGILRIKDSFIKDSPISVRFEKYVATDGSSNELFNLALVHNMHFLWTAQLKNLKYLPGYHVDIIESSGIQLRGNRYELINFMFYAEKNRGIGIHSFNSRVSAKWLCNESVPQVPCQSEELRSTFLNLFVGFYATVSASTRTIEAGYGIYENNNTGIQCTGLIDPMLLDNEFKVPNADNRSGIALSNCTGYAVENNYFTSMFTSPVNDNIGVYVQSSGPAMNEIYKNRFKNITMGIASIGQNALCSSGFQVGLKWQCNRFDRQIPYADIYVHTGSVSDDQGFCTTQQGAGSPAINIFSHSTPATARDIRVRTLSLATCGGVNFDLDYDHPNVTGGTPLVLRLEPLSYTGGGVVDVNACINDFPSPDDCPVINSAAPPGLGDTGFEGKSGDSDEPASLEEYVSLLEDFYADMAQLESLEETAYQTDEFQLWHSLTRAAQWDSTGSFPKEEVYALLNEYQLSPLFSRYTAALAGELGHETPEWVNTADDLSLTSDQEELAGIESAGLPYEIHEVIDASYFNSASNTAAFVELYHENHKVFAPYPLDIEADLPDSYGNDEYKVNRPEEGGHLINVRPNPFDENFILSFESSETYSSARIVFYDLLGRTISDKNYGKISQVEIDGSQFPSGVLIYSVYLDGKLFDTGRIVKSE